MKTAFEKGPKYGQEGRNIMCKAEVDKPACLVPSVSHGAVL